MDSAWPGKNDIKTLYVNVFSMSFIVAFCKTKRNGIMRVKGMTNSLIFRLFLKQLYNFFNVSDPYSNEKQALEMDNVFIHK